MQCPSCGAQFPAKPMLKAKNDEAETVKNMVSKATKLGSKLKNLKPAAKGSKIGAKK